MSAHIPCEIQEEIIKRLPVKSLIRFSSVSKAWKSLINCSKFIAAYSVRHTQPQHLLIRYEVGDWEETEIEYVSFVDDDTFPQQNFSPTVSPLIAANRLTIIGSSHGLCCYYREQQEEDVAVLWNPFIGKSIGVVVPNVLKERFSSVLGFGVCPHTGDPKLVKVTCIRSPWKTKPESISCIPCQVMVFSLSSKNWTIPCNNLPRKSILFTWSQAVVGQFIYWLALDCNIVVDGEFQHHYLIMSFDMTNEEFREVNLPDSLVCHLFMNLPIFKLRDSLALLEYPQEITWKEVISVWMMEHGDPKSFTRLYTINPPLAPTIQITLGFRKSGEPIIDMILDSYCSTLVVYDPFSEHSKDHGILANRRSFSVNSYTESLLLFNEEDDRIYSI